MNSRKQRKLEDIDTTLKTLAIEQSTGSSSAAILEDSDVVAEIRWQPDRPRNQELFMRLPGLLDSSGITAAEIDVFAVGTGPGSFSGVRSSIAMAQAMAMPDVKPVIGVGSTETIAREVLKSRPGADRIVVVGDARRKRLWFADLAVTNGIPTPKGDVILIDSTDLPERLAGGATVATPDWNRIGDMISAYGNSGTDVIEGPVSPEAQDAGIIAVERLALDAPLPSPVPVYLHPPVFVEPRF